MKIPSWLLIFSYQTDSTSGTFTALNPRILSLRETTVSNRGFNKMAPRTFQISLIGCDCLKGFILPCNLSFQKDLVHILWLDTIRDLRLVALGFGFVDRELCLRLAQNCNLAMKPSPAENVIHILLVKISTNLNLGFREFGMRKRSAARSFVTWQNAILLTERSLQSYTLAIKEEMWAQVL